MLSSLLLHLLFLSGVASFNSLSYRVSSKNGLIARFALTGEQSEAVRAPLIDEGNSLGTAIRVQAGPGSGKTRVIVHRIEHLLLEESVPARNLLALTFTRKAADEMRERLDRSLEVKAMGKAVTVSTLHGFCVRILRRFAEICFLRDGDSFSIYDDDDSRRVVKALLQDYEYPSEMSPDDIARFQVAKVYERMSQVKRANLIAGEGISDVPVSFPSSTGSTGQNESEEMQHDNDEKRDEKQYALQLTNIAHT